MINIQKLIVVPLKELLVYAEALNAICNRYEADITPLYNPLQGMSTLTPEQYRLSQTLNKYKGILAQVMQAIEIKTESELEDLCEKKEPLTIKTTEPKKTKTRKNVKKTKE